MKKIHISYGNEPYYKSLDLLEKTSLEIGKSDCFFRYTREWLELTDFYKKNKYILDQKRGNGFWCFKTHIILNAFSKLEYGDIVLYSDAALSVINDLTPLFDLTNIHNKLIFKLPHVGATHIAKIWTKRDAFVLMKCDTPEYWNANMTNGAVSVWKKTDENIEFIKEWQKYLRDPRIVTDEPNMAGLPNFLEFKDHRHDQSVLSLLAVKYKFEMFRDPTQWGNYEKKLFTNSPYKQLFDHYRQKL